MALLESQMKFTFFARSTANMDSYKILPSISRPQSNLLLGCKQGDSNSIGSCSDRDETAPLSCFFRATIRSEVLNLVTAESFRCYFLQNNPSDTLPPLRPFILLLFLLTPRSADAAYSCSLGKASIPDKMSLPPNSPIGSTNVSGTFRRFLVEERFRSCSKSDLYVCRKKSFMSCMGVVSVSVPMDFASVTTAG